MADAQLEDSEELKAVLEEWGLKDAFHSAQRVVKSGSYRMNDNVSFPVSKGTYIAVMKSGRVVMGSSPEAAALQAQYTSVPDPTHH